MAVNGSTLRRRELLAIIKDHLELVKYFADIGPAGMSSDDADSFAAAAARLVRLIEELKETW